MAEPDAQKPGLPTIHHLNDSQSQRILWLIEEIGIEYNLVLHKRNPKTRRAPPSLAKVHPLGKAPVLVTADGQVIIESAAIAGFLIRTYDKTGKHASEDVVREETLTSFSGSSLHVWGSIALLFDLTTRNTPWPLSYLAGAVERAMRNNFIDAEFKKSMEYLQEELGDQDWFNGKEPGRADIMLSYPFEQIIQRGWMDMNKDYPALGAWRTRIIDRPAWKRGIEKGNGFDLLNV